MRPQKVLRRIVGGSTNNVGFGDFCGLIVALGFELDRSSGSHQIYYHPGTRARLNLQPLKNGHAKPYQVRQLLSLIERYDLEVRGGDRGA